MKEIKQITNEEVLEILDSLENQDELSMKDMYNAQMLLLLDIRNLLKKSCKQELSNLVTDPTKATNGDIVIGKDE